MAYFWEVVKWEVILSLYAHKNTEGGISNLGCFFASLLHVHVIPYHSAPVTRTYTGCACASSCDYDLTISPACLLQDFAICHIYNDCHTCTTCACMRLWTNVKPLISSATYFTISFS